MAHRIDVLVEDGDGQRLNPQAFAAAGRAGPAGHEALQLAADVVGGGLAVAPLQVRDHALVVRLEEAVVAFLVDVLDRDRVALLAAVEDDVHLVLRELGHRDVEWDLVVLGHRLQHGVVDGLGVAIPRFDRAAGEAQALIGHEQIRVELHLAAQAGAGGAGAVRAVEAERARLDLRQADAAGRAGEPLGEEAVVRELSLGDVGHQHHAAAQAQGGLHGISEPRAQRIPAILCALIPDSTLTPA